MKLSKKNLLILAVIVIILCLIVGVWYLILPLLNVDHSPTSLDRNPNLPTGPVDENQLAASKAILDYLWENMRFDSNGLYTLALECDGECIPSMRTTNHPILIWARHSYVQATGDPVELERLKADIDSFYNTFLDPNMPYRTSAFGCSTLNLVREESTYLPDDYKDRLLQLCSRSVLSADNDSYYGKTFGLAGGIDEAGLNEILPQLLQPFAGDTLDEKTSNYFNRREEFLSLLPDPNSPTLRSQACVDPMRPIVGNLCDAPPQRLTIEAIYDERYPHLLNNQLAKQQLDLQPYYLDQMPAQPTLALATKGLVADGLMYYYANGSTEEYALGKKCLLRQGLRNYLQISDNQPLNQRIREFIRPENFDFPDERLQKNDQYVASLFECAMADVNSYYETFGDSVNKAWQTWTNSDYRTDGMFSQPAPIGGGLEISTLTNSIIAGTLAKTNQR